MLVLGRRLLSIWGSGRLKEEVHALVLGWLCNTIAISEIKFTTLIRNVLLLMLAAIV